MRKTLTVLLLFVIWRQLRQVRRGQHDTLLALLALHTDARIIADHTAPDPDLRDPLDFLTTEAIKRRNKLDESGESTDE